MIPARREALVFWAIVAALCVAGLALSALALATIGPWWCLAIAAFVVLAFVQGWRIVARPLPLGGER